MRTPTDALTRRVRRAPDVASATMKIAAMDNAPKHLAATLNELARMEPGATPVISVYLDTRWSDEHQRERVRIFLRNEVRRATAMTAGQLEDDLAWITAQGDHLVRQEFHPEAAGVAMFAGGPPTFREVMHVPVPFADTFTVADRPSLRPLGDAPRAAVLFVDGTSARVVALPNRGRPTRSSSRRPTSSATARPATRLRRSTRCSWTTAGS